MDFYLYLNGDRRGPFSEARVQQWLQDGLLRESDLAAQTRDGDLQPLTTARIFATSPAPAAQTPPAVTLPKAASENLGAYARATLAPNETAHLRTSLHWIIFARFGLLGLMLFVFVALPFAVAVQALTGSQIGWFAIPLPIFAMIPPAVAFASSELVVTNIRVLIKTGILRRRSLEMFISKVESISVDQGVLGRLLDYGTVMVRGTGGFQEPFRCIARPLEFRNCVQRLQSSAQPAGPA